MRRSVHWNKSLRRKRQRRRHFNVNWKQSVHCFFSRTRRRAAHLCIKRGKRMVQLQISAPHLGPEWGLLWSHRNNITGKKHSVGPDHKAPQLTKPERTPCFPRQQALLLHWSSKGELHPCSSVVLAANLGPPPQIHSHSFVSTKSKHRECTASWSLS